MKGSKQQRIEWLLNKIRIEQKTTIDNLAEESGVSTATIRRDLKVLEKKGTVVQTVGGGVVFKKEYTGGILGSEGIRAINEKIRIAEYCTELVREQDDILISPGTTTFLAGKIMSGISDRTFRIITNSLELALETSEASNIRTVMLGGEIWNRHSVAIQENYEYFKSCHHQHTLILSADGVHSREGISIFETRIIPVIKAMVNVSNRVILAADSGKFGKTKFNQVLQWKNINMFVTDKAAPAKDIAFLKEQGIQVVQV